MTNSTLPDGTSGGTPDGTSGGTPDGTTGGTWLVTCDSWLVSHDDG